MVDANLHWLVLHMGLEYSCFVLAPLLFSNAKLGL